LPSRLALSLRELGVLAELGDLVFTDPLPRQLSQFGMVEILRSHLRTVRLEAPRLEQFKTTASRFRIRVHDLRGTVVTGSLANGKSEAWGSGMDRASVERHYQPLQAHRSSLL
jgi:hypothetical protein